MIEGMIIAAACGLAVGILSGLLGIGGGIIIIPLMRLGFGVDGLIASGTSLFAILPTSLSGVIGRLRTHSINIKIGAMVGLGGVVFSPIGSYLSEMAGGAATMIAAAIVIAYTGANMIRKARKMPKLGGKAAESATVPATTESDAVASTATATSTAPASSTTAAIDQNVASAAPSAAAPAASIEAENSQYTDAINFKINGKNALKLLATGAIAGFLSGFIGVGGGFIIVPLLMWLFNFSFKDASGASLMALCILAVPGIITHGLYGHIDYLRGLMIVIGSIPGAFIGTALLKHVHERTLRIAFGFLLFAVSVTLAVNEFPV